MAWDFPASPTVGQQFIPVVGGPTFTFNGTGWISNVATSSASDYGFRATKSGTDQLLSTSNVKLTFTTEELDRGGYYDAPNSKWTPPASFVHLSCLIQFKSSSGTGDFVYLSIAKNGTIIKSHWIPVSSGDGGFGAVSVDFDDYANGTDYYEVFGRSTGGVASIYGTTPVDTYFQGHTTGGRGPQGAPGSNGLDGANATTTAPTIQRFLTAGAFTYNRPAGVKWIRIRGTAGGGGGATTGGSANGGAGGNTVFDTMTFGGGGGGASINPGSGGVVSGTLPTGASWSLGPFQGSTGSGGATIGNYNMGGAGGGTMFGPGAGGGGQSPGYGGAANTGGGGGGGGWGGGSTVPSGGGGGGGASGELIITNPAASYSGLIGGGGAAGAFGGQYAGGTGSSGGIWIEEHYNY